ncbi:conserved hypothetical protein [Psychromonas ingrahamii 37]|uniref:Amphi-Trp domain-containing protein n=1 Tax=Psychromonas ingrahamii (strain DSM 17664 / CCUG 51855 / 37) TaxID=357804 RepID=A1SX44_PSYIN|nr:amphi-Trp domain-containing protein [Psychromonas ingrahamii]ABM04059.1 conserved hypothetical protein [Psychromonas ingrahamii 37]
MHQKEKFRHQSLQDCKSIKELLNAIGKGFSKGQLTFSDDGNEWFLLPKGLLDCKVSVSEDEARHRLELKISWDKPDQKYTQGELKVK